MTAGGDNVRRLRPAPPVAMHYRGVRHAELDDDGSLRLRRRGWRLRSTVAFYRPGEWRRFHLDPGGGARVELP